MILLKYAELFHLLKYVKVQLLIALLTQINPSAKIVLCLPFFAKSAKHNVLFCQQIITCRNDVVLRLLKTYPSLTEIIQKGGGFRFGYRVIFAVG
jgi:hypothetical protein